MSDKLGPIEIEFLLDKKADAEAKNLKNSLDAIGTTGKKAGTVLKEAIKGQIDLIKELETDVKNLEKSFKNVAAGIQKRDIAKKLADTRGYLAQEQERLIRLQNQQIEANKREEESANSLTGMISKWALGLGGAAVGLKELMKAFKETSAGLNAFNIVGAITSQVLYDIVSGAGLSMARITSAVAIQKELNALRVEGYIASYKAAVKNNEYQQAYSDSLDATLSRGEKIKKIDEALEAHAESIKIQQEEVRKAIRLTQIAFLNQPGSEKLKKQISELKIELENLGAEQAGADKRLRRQRSVLIQEEIDEIKQWREDLHKGLTELIDDYNREGAAKLKELNDAIALNRLKGQEKELLQLKQKYEEDLENWKDNQEIRAALAEKYAQDQYAIAMKYLDLLKKENEKLAADILKIDPGRGYSLLKRSLTKKKSPLIPTNQSEEEIEKKVKENLEKQHEQRQLILESAILYTSELVSQLGLSEESTAALNSMLGIVMQLASGNFIGAAFNLLSKVLATILTMRDLPEEPSWKKQIEAWDKLIERQERLIDLSKRTGGMEAALRAEIALQQKKIDELLKYISEQRARRSSNDDLREELDLLAQYRQDLADTQQELDDLLTGGITENTIADAIAQGCADGKTSLDDLADYLNDVLFNAALDVFKNEILGNALTEYKKMITDAFSDKIFTEEEKDAILRRGEELTAEWKETWDKMMGGFDTDQGDENSLKGAIKGITADQASLLAGQTNAIRIAQATANNMLQSSLKQLMIISDNTSYCKHLESIDSKLDALNNNSLRAKGIA